LVFDSGVGGLSVASCIRKKLLAVELVYLADNAGFPTVASSHRWLLIAVVRLLAKRLSNFPVTLS
jgi:glutamate racemase